MDKTNNKQPTGIVYFPITIKTIRPEDILSRKRVWTVYETPPKTPYIKIEWRILEHNKEFDMSRK